MNTEVRDAPVFLFCYSQFVILYPGTELGCWWGCTFWVTGKLGFLVVVRLMTLSGVCCSSPPPPTFFFWMEGNEEDVTGINWPSWWREVTEKFNGKVVYSLGMSNKTHPGYNSLSSYHTFRIGRDIKEHLVKVPHFTDEELSLRKIRWLSQSHSVSNKTHIQGAGRCHSG